MLTEEEAEREAREYIENSLCYFNPDFLVYPVFGIKRHTPNYDNAKKAAKADGRGHFIAFYDGLEHYSNGYYIYRID